MHVGDCSFGISLILVEDVCCSAIRHDYRKSVAVQAMLPRQYLHCRFIGISTSRTAPYMPNISRKWFSLTFFVSFSTTIFELLGGPAGLRLGLRDPLPPGLLLL